MSTIPMIIMLIAYLQCTYAMLGYDCGGNKPNFTRVSLKGVGECKMVNSTSSRSNKIVQVVQIKDTYKVRVSSCKVVISRDIYHCGAFSHNSISRNGKMNYLYKIGKSDCMKAISTGQLTISGGFKPIYIDGLELNKQYDRAVTLAGNVDELGKCQGGPYSDYLGDWDSVLVIGQVTVLLTESMANVNPKNDIIHLPGSIRHKYSDSSVLDAKSGYSYWDLAINTECSPKLTQILYQGTSDVYIGESKSNNILGSIVVVDSSSHLFSMTLMTETHMCGCKAYRTEHPSIVVFLQDDNSIFPLSSQPVENDGMDILLYVNAKFVYLEKSVKKNTENLYNQIMYNQCLNRKSVFETQISLAYTNPHGYAYLYMGKEGYAGRVLGEVIYVIECNPVEVKVRETDKCYNEIPVSHNSEEMFLLAPSRLLQKKGTQIECSNIFYPAYMVDNTWVSIHHGARESVEPIQLDPNLESNWKFTESHSLATSGIYTDEEVSSMRDQIMYGSEREAVSNILVRAFSGIHTDRQGGSIYQMMDIADEEKLTERLTHRIFGWLSFMGEWTSFAMGIFYLVMAIKYLVSVGLGYRNLRGIACGAWRIFASIVTPISNFILHEFHKNPEPSKIKRERSRSGNKSPYKEVSIRLSDIDSTEEELFARATAPLYPPLKEDKE